MQTEQLTSHPLQQVRLQQIATQRLSRTTEHRPRSMIRESTGQLIRLPELSHVVGCGKDANGVDMAAQITDGDLQG
jgi:hypothetical protein